MQYPELERLETPATLDDETGPVRPAYGGREQPSTYAVRRFRLTVTQGKDAGVEKASDGDRFTIGALPRNDLPLRDPTVSRHHCTITITPKGFVLKDLGSLNGTSLGGYRVETAFVEHGAVIGVGQSKLRFEVLDEVVRSPISASSRFGQVLGQSPAMRRVFAVMGQVAPTDASVLLEGETGTGKTLVAEMLHEQSPRSAGPLVVVDCGAIPARLIESELFGHERGAFTGAHVTRVGAFETARGGTVFLDEIGELPLEVQPKLLRVLDKRTITRVGSNRPIPIDVRVIAATNKELGAEVNRGAFRADLYYRLNVVSMRLPSLSERLEDVPLLIKHFWHKLAGAETPIPPSLLESLARREYPGNVRELHNVVERAFLLDADDDPDLRRQTVEAAGPAMLAAGTAPMGVDALGADSFREAKEAVVSRWEKQYLKDLLRANDGNVSRAARTARMDRNHLRDLLRRYDIDPGGE